MPQVKTHNSGNVRRAAKWLIYMFVGLLLLVILTGSAIYLLAGTNKGLQLISSIANKHVSGLDIREPQGSLHSGVKFNQIQFNNDNINILGKDISSQWSLECLLKKQFCLNKLHIESLDIITANTSDSVNQDKRSQSIELPEISLPVNISADDITIAVLNLTPSGNDVTQSLNDVRLSASTRDDTVLIKDLSFMYEQYTSRLAGDINLQGDYPLNLSHSLVALDVLPNDMPEGAGEQPLTLYTQLSGSLANLELNSSTRGIAEMKLQANLQPLQPDIPVSFTLTSQIIGWPISSRSQVQGKQIAFEAMGDINELTFNLQTILSGEKIPQSNVSLTGMVSRERISLNEILIGTLGGTASGRANASFAAPLQWNTQWEMQDINPAFQIPELEGLLDARLELDGLVDAGRWSLNVEEFSIDGSLRDLPFVLDAKGRKALNDIWLVEKINLKNEANQIQLEGIVSDEFDIDAQFTLPQLQNIVPGAEGGFNANVRVGGAVANPDISLDASAEELSFDDVSIQSLKVQGEINKLFIADSNLNASFATLQSGDSALTDSIISLNGTRASHQLSFNTKGPQQSRLDLTLDGNLQNTLDWDGVVTNTDISIPDHSIELRDNIGIRWRQVGKTFTVSSHCWTLEGESNLCLLDEFNSGASGQSRITLDAYSLQSLNNLLPPDKRVSGSLSMSTELSWDSSDANNKQAIINATIDDAAIQARDGLGDPVTLFYERIDADATLRPENADIQFSLRSENLGNADVSLNIDPSDPQRSLNGSLLLEGLKLDIAQPFLPDLDQLSGRLSAKGTLAGTLDEPAYNGNLLLDDPVLRSELLPIPITGGQLIASIAGKNLTLDGQVNSDQGTITVDGKGNLDPLKWSTSVILTGENLNVQKDPLEQSTVNHRIRIDADARRVSVGGDIDIPQAVINVEALPQGAAVVSTDVIIVEDIAAEAATGLSDNRLNLALNLDVSLGDAVTVSAYGLDANLAGDMDIRIRGDRPAQLGGEIRVVDGVFKKYGQDLEANGQIIFVGPVESTRLAIDAVREIDDEDRTAGLRIQGTVAQPEITLFTDPSDKSQDAILSYVVLGRDINEASDQDADLLATAALALAIRGGSAVGGGIAQALGVREFGLETQGSGDNTELVISGRLNDRILLSYGRGVFDAQNTLYLRYDLTRQLYLEAATSTIDNALDIFYSFSF